MKRLTKYIISIFLGIAILGSATVVFAAQGDGPGRRGPGFGPGAGGEVTAVSDSSLTVRSRNDETVVVNVNDETRVRVVETQSEGSLSDIEVGDLIGVRGRKNDDDSVTARGILLLPDGDQAGGRVTAVDGSVISVEGRKPGQTDTTQANIITNADTQFRVGPNGTGSLSDVTEDTFVMAFGETQSDGSLLARLVFVQEAGQQGSGRGSGQGFRGGEVTAVNGASFTLKTRRGGELTVLTDDSTEYRTRDGQDVSFADIEVGKRVMVQGEPVEEQENTIQADVVGIRKNQAK